MGEVLDLVENGGAQRYLVPPGERRRRRAVRKAHDGEVPRPEIGARDRPDREQGVGVVGVGDDGDVQARDAETGEVAQHPVEIVEAFGAEMEGGEGGDARPGDLAQDRGRRRPGLRAEGEHGATG
jgi:hypothetical protein